MDRYKIDIQSQKAQLDAQQNLLDNYKRRETQELNRQNNLKNVSNQTMESTFLNQHTRLHHRSFAPYYSYVDDHQNFHQKEIIPSKYKSSHDNYRYDSPTPRIIIDSSDDSQDNRDNTTFSTLHNTQWTSSKSSDAWKWQDVSRRDRTLSSEKTYYHNRSANLVDKHARSSLCHSPYRLRLSANMNGRLPFTSTTNMINKKSSPYSTRINHTLATQPSSHSPKRDTSSQLHQSKIIPSAAHFVRQLNHSLKAQGHQNQFSPTKNYATCTSKNDVYNFDTLSISGDSDASASSFLAARAQWSLKKGERSTSPAQNLSSFQQREQRQCNNFPNEEISTSIFKVGKANDNANHVLQNTNNINVKPNTAEQNTSTTSAKINELMRRARQNGLLSPPMSD